MSSARHLIIGNGMAGITAAQEIRRRDLAARITLLGDEGRPFYYRASLSEWISGEITDEMLPGRTEAFYDDLAIERMDGHVVSVDPEARTVSLADGASVPYDRLLIATGARAKAVPVEGLDEALVFRGLDDARRIKERAEHCARALIVGGGVLGLELAGAMHKAGVEGIAVVQRTPPLGSPLLDATCAAWLGERMRADGVDLFVGDTVERVEGSVAHLHGGATWTFDLFVQAIGITPTFPQAAGIEAGRGIRIDRRCATNLPGVYAAGDCTETLAPGAERWATSRIWLQCAQQGKTAGANMAGGEETLPERPFFNASYLYTVPYAYIGEPYGDDGETYTWRGAGGFRLVRVVDGRLAGAMLLGERHGMLALHAAVGADVGAAGQEIARPEFAYNELCGRDWDYLFY